MCTRYFVDLSPELKPYIDEANHSPLRAKMVTVLGKPFKDQGEIRPTDMAAVIAPSVTGEKKSFPMVWGYRIEGINSPVVNARVETAKSKKNFASDWQKHRCIIPASYYFEWMHIPTSSGKMKTGQRYAIQPKGVTVTYLAGLYRIEQFRDLHYPVFTILTKEPTEQLAKIHNRMPVILPEEKIDLWIQPDADPEAVLKSALTDMICETS